VADATVTLSPLFPDAWLVAGSTPPGPAHLRRCRAAPGGGVVWCGRPGGPLHPLDLQRLAARGVGGGRRGGGGHQGPVGVAPEALPEAVYGAGSGAAVLEQGVLGDGSPTWVKACVVASGPSGLGR
jgi:hypothetical protein